jgi:ribosomal protein S18 acetylase RimI-like enzyme
MATIREARPADLPVLWTLATLPNIGQTADPSAPLPLPAADEPPEAFPDLTDPTDPARHFLAFLVAEQNGHLAAMGGIRPAADHPGRAEVLRIRVHPARRRRGLGRRLMAALEERASALGYDEMLLNTATNQPEAMAGAQRILGKKRSWYRKSQS